MFTVFRPSSSPTTLLLLRLWAGLGAMSAQRPPRLLNRYLGPSPPLHPTYTLSLNNIPSFTFEKRQPRTTRGRITCRTKTTRHPGQDGRKPVFMHSRTHSTI